MREINKAYTVLFSTFVSVFIMISYNFNLNNSRKYAEYQSCDKEILNDKKEYIAPTIISMQDNSYDEYSIDATGRLGGISSSSIDNCKERTLKIELDNETLDKNIESNNINTNLSEEIKKNINKLQNSKRFHIFEDYYDNKENGKPLFKIAAEKIMESLSITDKVKLLYVSMQLGKDKYNKVESYLYSDNVVDGLLKALKLLRNELTDEEYNKVRKIANKFINMDVAENLN